MTIPAPARRVALAAGLPVFLRLLLLPVLPIPLPGVADEFSYLLAADTFAHGRLANPPLPFGGFFESFHILVTPTYASMYPVGQGFFLFLGQALLGAPWAGVVLSVALMCGAVCWALDAALPPRWSLAGALAFGLLFGVESYWMNSYWGGAVPALGGALVVGSILRLVKSGPPPRRPAILGTLAGTGAVVLLHTRPWEGLCLAFPGALMLVAWLLGKNANGRGRRIAAALPAAAVLFAGTIFLFHDDRKVTGDALVPPYLLNLRRYYVAPLFAWDAEKPAPTYPNETMRRFYVDWRISEDSLRASGEARDPFRLLFGWFRELKFCGGAILAGIVCAFALRFRGKNRLLLSLLAGVLAGLSVTRVQQLHYLAPAAALFVMIQMQGLRTLGTFRIAGRRLLRFLPAIVVLAAAIGLVRNVALTVRRRRSEHGFAERRVDLLARLAAQPGAHLIFVRYGPRHVVHDEWVYNGAALDEERVVFAHDVSATEDRNLAARLGGRTAWLIEPEEGDRLTPLDRGAVSPHPLPAPWRPPTPRATSPFSRASSPSASVPACTSAASTRAASTTSSTRSSTTRSTRSSTGTRRASRSRSFRTGERSR